jgi:hypothetical protein
MSRIALISLAVAGLAIVPSGCGSNASTTTESKPAPPSYLKFEESFRHQYVEGPNRGRLRNVEFRHEISNGSTFGRGYVVEGWGVLTLNGHCFSERAFVTTGGEILESKDAETPPNAEENPCVHGTGH